MAKQRKQTKQKKFIPSPKIKEIAGELDAEYKKHIQLTVLKEGAVGYKDIIVKQNKNDNWALYSIYNTKDMISEFKLKTCAVMAAKAYSTVSLNRFTEIKELDNNYWANHINKLVYKRIIKSTLDLDRFIIILNKLEDSEFKEQHFKDKITSMFRSSFA